MSISCSLVRRPSGEAEFVVAQIQDITERKAIERINDELVSVVSHELRAPLTSIRDALGGSALTGTDGTTSTALGSGQTIDEDYGTANSGMTFAKVAQAKYLMDVAKVPTAGRYMICGAQEQQDLILNVEQLVNSRYTNVQPITDGILSGKTWMGFLWIADYQDLTLSESNHIRTCFAVSKPGVTFGQNSKQAFVDRLPGRSQTTQIMTCARMGATRLQEENVVAVECYHA